MKYETKDINAVVAEIEDPIDALCQRMIKKARSAPIKPTMLAVSVWHSYGSNDGRIEKYVLGGIAAHIRALLKKPIDGLPGYIHVTEGYKKTSGATWRELEENARRKLQGAADDAKAARRILHLAQLLRPYGETAVVSDAVDVKKIDWSKVDEED